MNISDNLKHIIQQIFRGGVLIDFIKKSINLDNFSPSDYSNNMRFQNDGNSVFNYEFVMSLPEKDYAKYLSISYFTKTDKKLNLKNPRTIDEKIQWLKLYDNNPVKTKLTDKVLVRDWIQEKIGKEYLKNILWTGTNFDDIPLDELPNSFVIKTNHGCKWHFIIKNKQEFIENTRLFDIVKTATSNWMHQSFFGWSDFETQYKDIKPQILIEELYRETDDSTPTEFEIWCFNGQPKIFQEIKPQDNNTRKVSTYDEFFDCINLAFHKGSIIENHKYSEHLLKAVALSKILSKDFTLVRIDWMLFKDKLYFEEMTFTPFSGFISCTNDYDKWQLRMGDMLNLKGKQNDRKK